MSRVSQFRVTGRGPQPGPLGGQWRRAVGTVGLNSGVSDLLRAEQDKAVVGVATTQRKHDPSIGALKVFVNRQRSSSAEWSFCHLRDGMNDGITAGVPSLSCVGCRSGGHVVTVANEALAVRRLSVSPTATGFSPALRARRW